MNEHNPNAQPLPAADMPQDSDLTRAPGETLQLKIADVTVNFSWIPPGVFLMGSPESEKGHCASEKLHEVTITKGFWLAQTLTTVKLWTAVMGKTEDYINNYVARKILYKDYFWRSLKSIQYSPNCAPRGSRSPVKNLSWYDCRDFIDELDRRYSTVLPSGYKYAIPSEACWEYACRAGTATPYNFGSKEIHKYANCNSIYWQTAERRKGKRFHVAPVTTYPPNDWGLFDMHGNLKEWTADWYAWDYYSTPEASTDPVGPRTGAFRVLRGGSWNGSPILSRSASRSYCEPDGRSSEYGFRIALTPADA